jgi:hypothetical protein
MSDLLNRVFALIAGVFWLATLAAVGWQVWGLLFENASQMITVRMAFERLWGAVPVFTGDSAQVIFAIVSGLSLVLFLGLCALAFSALAKVLD